MAQATKLALVTGASTGIGFELARQFAQHGYDLVVAADEAQIHVAAQELSGTGRKVTPVEVDLRTEDGVAGLYQQATADGRRLDAAAINAGIGRAGRFVDGDLNEDLAIVDLNVRSTVHLARLVLGDMVDRGSGRVLFTSSTVAAMPGSYQSIYNASKSFVQSFAEALHDELRDTGVSVTALMPGPVDTEFFTRAKMRNTPVGGPLPKDDPADVARQGYEALMRGDRKVVASSLMSKALGAANTVLPDAVKARLNRLIARPMDR
ncbi:SDR family NAD(P)-dependent oxidoreductase [Mycolicibacterium litorale]|uniref:Oxidoreductase n=1 Tax=Mycolicibacterium litorale TaxID=758802 RepID=A0AAD1MSK3_9MYCO|nr:SDR family NAD(P)-dependent oxidoreductase [Mycolicibacterium litorale]MCV7418871.1 SDR family NAD(P)-dependent oxidoreductase [Mycolicibacterium litorale]TDY00343.1 short-subunit dehydrogenase [Mycolicibacterium litorale]BBY15825.1 oxidoreductase [Mycolicibacterium litorale]